MSWLNLNVTTGDGESANRLKAILGAQLLAQQEREAMGREVANPATRRQLLQERLETDGARRRARMMPDEPIGYRRSGDEDDLLWELGWLRVVRAYVDGFFSRASFIGIAGNGAVASSTIEIEVGTGPDATWPRPYVMPVDSSTFLVVFDCTINEETGTFGD